MSTNSRDLPQPASSAKRKWPDMSAYGIHFGIVTMPNKESRLVMVDDEGSWAPLAKAMGFSQSRWFGLYVKSSTKLDIPGFKSSFPSAKVLELTFEEIRERIKPLILARKNKRLSQMQAGRGRLSWHPTRTEVADAASQVVESVAESGDQDATLSPEQALRQTLLLGMNYMGQDVYESGDGQRFVRTGDSVIAKESFDAAPDPVFLRARTDDDLTHVAAGMVEEIASNKRLHSDDFIRFMEASLGAGSYEDKEAVGRFHAALDKAMRQRIESFEGASRETFDEALRLHEGRPTFWRAAGTMATPLPISVVMQSLAAARANAAVDSAVAPVIIDITGTPRSHSWALSATSVSGGDVPAHDISLAGVFGRPTAPKSISGIRVTRTDTEQLLETLAKRSPDGLTVFTITADVAGKLDNEFRRVLSAIGERYEVSGLTDIDAAMIGPGSTQCSRLVVVGHKRETPDYTFAVPGVIPVIYDYAALWNWGEAIRATQFGEIQSFGDDGRETNRWQAPYIPSSQISEPVAMSPRNMLGPVRKALANLVERHGSGVDEYVCDKLGWTMEQLEKSLDAEQADAVALAIQAIDDGAAIVEGDATGLGKGRVAATLALYGKRKGMPVMFMTEKADLFSDFYRDVADVGGMDALKNPFVVNSDLVIRDVSTGAEIARTPKRDVASQTFACGEVPTKYDLVLATYSQFNREYNPIRAAHNVALSRTLKNVIAGTESPFEALSSVRHQMGLVSYAAVSVVDEQGAIAYEQTQAAVKKVTKQDVEAKQHEAMAVALQSSTAAAAFLSSLVKSDMTSLKHQWLYSGAMDGALLILDEAHVAAGETSKTGVNLRYLKDRAGAINYSSATFAKDTANFALYSRVFPSTLRVATIGETLERGGEPMQEILSAMLAEDGRLIRREHDLSNVDFRNSVDLEHRERNTNWSDALARVLSTMSFLSGEVDEIVTKINEEAEKAANLAKKSNPSAAATPNVGLHYTNFGSKFYNLSRAFSMAMNADNAADLAIKALREGRKPVITVDNTMESVLRELIDGVQLDDEAEADNLTATAPAKPKSTASSPLSAISSRNDPLAELGGDDEPSILSGADPLAGLGEADAAASKKARNKVGDTVDLGRTVGFKDILVTYIESMFVARRQTRQGGKVISSVRVDMMKPELQALLDEVKHFIDLMPDVPLSPLDLVRERVTAAGFSIDEISGRRLALQNNPDGTHSVVRMAERKKLILKNDFNSGKLDALILSRSGSTGISLHASRTFADQSQRELIMLQLPADIVQMVQFIGRINRKGQVCNPVVTMACSGLPGELRLMMMHNSKLRKMSANVSGNADNAGKNEAPDILNRVGNEVAFRWMEANPKEAKLVGFDIGEIDVAEAHRNNTKFVDMLTSKIPMFLSHEQVRIYAELQTEFEALIEQYEMEGRNPLKAAEHDLRARHTSSKALQVASGRGSVFDAAVVASELTYEVKVPGLDENEPKHQAETGDYVLARDYGGKYAEVLAKHALETMESSLPGRLSKRHTSVSAALAETKPNDVKNTKAKFEWLAEFLPKVRPGSILALAGEEYAGQEDSVAARTDYYGIERVFITGWKLPANPMQMAGYKLVGYSSLTRRAVEFSLASVQSRPAKWVLADFARASDPAYKEAYDKEVNEFFHRAKADFKGEETRVILEGNLFRGAEIAEANKQGAAVTYTDEKGVWRHAILMPRYCTINNVGDLPITVDDADSLAAAFQGHTSDWNMTVTDDFRRVNNVNKHTYRLVGNNRRLNIQLYGTCQWLTGNEAVTACLVDQSFSSSRTMSQAQVQVGHEAAFLKAFMAAATEAGVRVLLDGEKRDWYNDYLNARQESAVNQDDIDNALAADDDELASLLAAPAM
jgi:hypothetical protein